MTATVLVTGGHGTMGPWVTRELRRRGARVVVLDVAAAPRFALPDAEPERAIGGDVRDTELVKSILAEERIERVIHLAAIVGAPCETDPVTAFEVNVIATARLIRAAEEAGVRRFTANSTKGALGPLPVQFLHPIYEPVPADHSPSPRQIYEVTKLGVERLIVAARDRGLSAAALRFTTTWGPGKTGESHAGLSFHSDLVAAARRGGEVSVDVDPDQGFDLIYYADVGAAIADACLADDPLRSAVYHVGGGRLTRMAEFATALEQAFPGCTIRMGDRFPPGRNVLFDIGLARNDFGYEPRFDVAAALADMIALDVRPG
ncbi:MAG TPA: NAD(P)-dependent oxidoreductase [Patescibacteria group bacterium]|nr:NAD(P)-dependent oxidoreductase [Patescibacteria group bacterium]